MSSDRFLLGYVEQDYCKFKIGVHVTEQSRKDGRVGSPTGRAMMQKAASGVQTVTFRRSMGVVIFFAMMTMTGGCSLLPNLFVLGEHVNIEDACSIVRNQRDWYNSMKKVARKWGIPVHVQMAILHQESKFQAHARPPRTKIFWFFPGPRPSSAFGYAQALDGTWAEYQKATDNAGADRDDFDDAVDFIGWYTDKSHKKLGLSKWDAKAQYLAYHEGQGGYARKSYLKKKWLLGVARKVNTNARRYHTQLKSCQKMADRVL